MFAVLLGKQIHSRIHLAAQPAALIPLPLPFPGSGNYVGQFDASLIPDRRIKQDKWQDVDFSIAKTIIYEELAGVETVIDGRNNQLFLPDGFAQVCL